MKTKMNTNRDDIKKIFADGKESQEKTVYLSEHELIIMLNERPAYRLVCTRDRLKELVYGRLFTDGIIKAPSDIRLFFLCESENEATVLLNEDIRLKKILNKEESCCSGNLKLYATESENTLLPIPGHKIDYEKFFYLARLFGRDSELHKETGAVHRSILLYPDEGEDKTAAFEDIGRHNTIDKAVGFSLINGVDLSKCMLFTSGRVPLDMVKKVIAAQIPVLISKSVPTADSVNMAKEYGLTLICRAHADSFQICS